jgi:hypothetical protein
LEDVVDEVGRRYTMETRTTAMREAEDRRHEAAMDKLGAKLAKKMGPVRVLGGDNVPMKVLSEEFKKSARRKIN